MTMKEQFRKIKDNWLIIAAVIVVLVFMNLGNLGGSFMGSMGNQYSKSMSASYDEMSYTGSSGYYPNYNSDFAPEVTERKLTKNANLQTEVERGTFLQAQQTMKNILSSSDSFLLQENVNNYGTEKKSYLHGSYQIKVDREKYDSVISQLKAIGEVQSFSESTTDITGQYTNNEIALQTEKDRLARYQQIYSEATTVEDKLNAEDRIFNQERTVKYLEDALNNMDRRIEYSTVSFTMTEKQSDYADVAMVKLSALLRNLVDSWNTLLYFLFIIAPWAVVALVVWVVWRMVRK